MSLVKKIILGFLISSAIVAVFVASTFVSFIEGKKEIRYLEMSDTVRSKSLLLRRHEKNFFLYGNAEESVNVHAYLKELKTALGECKRFNSTHDLQSLENEIARYEARFNHIEALTASFREEFSSQKPRHKEYSRFFPIIESTVLERPLVNAELLEGILSPANSQKITGTLKELDSEINALRKNGEEILTLSNHLDKSARDKVEGVIHSTEKTALIFIPLFLSIGLLTLFIIIRNVVNRLKLLTAAVEKTGKGDFSLMSAVQSGSDEVGILINKFNEMEEQLAQREKELLQSKKLAAIGTLASGVAHELNNPLNNIYTTAQRLTKKSGDACPDFVKKGLDDIFGETMRVKRIVGDLLEFARGREPLLREVDLMRLINDAYKLTGNSVNIDKVQFSVASSRDSITVRCDPEQMEQVFINLFTNAVDAMSGEGLLKVQLAEGSGSLTVRISDTGKGMSKETVEKVFEPFFTTKDKGTGLGLAIVFNIVQKHNGEIAVESAEGKGTSFIIRLPFAADR